MAAEIKYEIVGNPNFLRNIVYKDALPALLESYEDQFNLAEEVFIEFEEIMNLSPNIPIQNKLVVAEDGLKINLKFIESRVHLGNGKVNNPPSPSEFYRGFKYYFENTVISGDNERFDALNVNLEEE